MSCQEACCFHHIKIRNNESTTMAQLLNKHPEKVFFIHQFINPKKRS